MNVYFENLTPGMRAKLEPAHRFLMNPGVSRYYLTGTVANGFSPGPIAGPMPKKPEVFQGRAHRYNMPTRL